MITETLSTIDFEVIMHYVLRSNDVVMFSEILIFIIRLFLGT